MAWNMVYPPGVSREEGTAMFTVESLQQHPGAVKALTGLPAEEPWSLVGAVGARWAAAERARRARPGRRRCAWRWC